MGGWESQVSEGYEPGVGGSSVGEQDTSSVDSGGGDTGDIGDVPSGSFEGHDSGSLNITDEGPVDTTVTGDLDLNDVENTWGSRDVVNPLDNSSVETTITGDLSLVDPDNNFWGSRDLVATYDGETLTNFQYGYALYQKNGFFSALRQANYKQISGVLAAGLADLATDYFSGIVGTNIGAITTKVAFGILTGLGLSTVAAIGIAAITGMYAGYKVGQAVNNAFSNTIGNLAMGIPQSPINISDELTPEESDGIKEYFADTSAEEFKDLFATAADTLYSSIIPVWIYSQRSNIIGSGSPVV